jgi:hypothetical protein
VHLDGDGTALDAQQRGRRDDGEHDALLLQRGRQEEVTPFTLPRG